MALVVKVFDDCVGVCELVCVSLGGGVNSCDVVAEDVGNGGIMVVRLEIAVALDCIGGTTRVLEAGGGSGVGIIVNEPMLLEVELKAGGVKITGGIVGATVGGTAMLVVGGTAILVGGAAMLVVVLAVVLVVCASVISSPWPSHVCNSNTPRCAKSSTESLVEETSSHTMSTTCSTVLMPSRHVSEQRSPDAKSAWVHPMNGALYAMLHIVGRTPFAIGWRSFRETAAAVESMAAKPQSCDGCLRLARAWAAILPAAFVFPDSQLSILVMEVVIEPNWIPSHKVGPGAMCYRRRELKVRLSAGSRASGLVVFRLK
jgi:hypothetical protein